MYHILQKRFFAFITVGDEFLARKRLCDELVEVCHLIQLGQACLERLLDGGNQYFGNALRLDDFPFRETAVQECQFVKPNFRRFLGKPLCAVHILGRRHGNVQMTRPERFLKDCFFDGYKATLVGCNRDFCFIEMSLTVRKSDFVSDTQPQDAGTMLCFLFRKFVVFLYIGSIKYVHNITY